MTRHRILGLALGIAAVLQVTGQTPVAAAQPGLATQATLRVTGDVTTPLTLTTAELKGDATYAY